MNYYHPETLEHIRNPLPAVADWAGSTELAPPAYDPQIESCRFVDGAWVVEVNLPPAPIVPGAVTMRQARLALLQWGMLALVNTNIASMTGVEGEAAQIAWEFSGMVERNQPLVLSLGTTLGLTSGDLDQLFTLAATL